MKTLRQICGRTGLHTVRSVLVALVLLTAAVSPAAAAEAALKKLSLIPIWRHQAQFAGYYVAREKGIYARHGIDLTILDGGPDHAPEQYLKSGKADCAVLWLSTAIQQRSGGLKLVNLAQIVQRSSMVLIAKKQSGIRTVADMQNRKIGVWDAGPNLPAQEFFRKYRLRMKVIPHIHTVNLFLLGGIDVASAMWYNEYHTILNAGVNPDELQLFFLADHGIRFPEDGLYMLEKNYRKDPGLARAFARASLEGWHYAFEHPDEAIEIVLRFMKKGNIPANRAHQAWMLARMRDLILPLKNSGETGQLNQADYGYVGASLRASGLIRTIPGYQDFIGKPDARH